MKTEIQRKFLEIKSIKDLLGTLPPNESCKINLIDPPDFQLNKFFYKQVGKNHHWLDRLLWSEKQWINYINNPNLKTYILFDKNNLAGYFEQIFDKKKNECEIAYFGILEEYIGKKLGGYLLSEAIKKSFKIGAKRVWVHTCSLDHRHALNNYLSRGMKIFKSELISKS